MNSGFATDVKDQIKRATDIVELIGNYESLRRAGSNYVCHCPWHDDQRPSLQVNPQRQMWVCWVCNIRGDVFDFVMRREGVEFVEALRMLAERAGIALPSTPKKVVPGSVGDKQTLYRAMSWATEQYHRFLLESADAATARDYLSQRQISKIAIDQFRIGFAPTKFSWLADQGQAAGFSLDILTACDLISQQDRSSGFFERFRGRLIFPIFDTLGRTIAIGGRLVPGIELNSNAKYVNSRESRLFSKSETLYGLNFVKDNLQKTRSLVVVEGYTDVIAAWQAGMRDVVACLGTALNEKHIRVIKRFADRITLVLDGDDAGRKRANEVIDLFVTQDVDLRIITLPDGQDPLDFIHSQGATSLRQLVEQAADAVEHKIQVLTDGMDLVRDTHRANRALEEVLQTLARIPTSMFAVSSERSLRQEQLLTRLARQFGVETRQVHRRLAELRSKLAVRPNTSSEVEKAASPRDYSQLLRRESQLIQLLLHSPESVDTIIENVSPAHFVDGPLKELYCLIEDQFQQGKDICYDKLLLDLECPDLRSLLEYLEQEWREMQAVLDGQPVAATTNLVLENIQVFRKLDWETDKRQRINQMQLQKLDQKEELLALEELYNQTRQQHGL